MVCLLTRKNRTVLCVWTFREKFRRPRVPFEGSETGLGTDLMTSLFKNNYRFNLLSSHHRIFKVLPSLVQSLYLASGYKGTNAVTTEEKK
jgi:hypothetical protein